MKKSNSLVLLLFTLIITLSCSKGDMLTGTVWKNQYNDNYTIIRFKSENNCELQYKSRLYTVLYKGTYSIEKQFDTFELQDDEDRFIVMDTDWGLALGAINIDRSCIRMLMWINPITLTRI